MKKLIEITEIHPDDQFYSDREYYLGKQGVIDTKNIKEWINQEPRGYYFGDVEIDHNYRCFYAFRYNDVKILPEDNKNIISSLKEIKEMIEKLIEDADKTSNNAQ